MLIRRLEFVLENCEIIRIDGKYIGHFYAGDIKKEIARNACNDISMNEICHSFCVEIHRDANKKYAPFGNEEWETLAFDRLQQYADITSVIIRLYNQYDEENKDDESKDTVYDYLIHWGGDDDYINPLQKSKVAKTGWFYLAIGEEMNLDEIFPDEEMNDEEYADHRAAMMDIGDKYWEEHEKLLRSCSAEEDANVNEENNEVGCESNSDD